METSNIRKVLLAIDGSEHSDRAFNWYLENLHRKNDVAILVHVEDVPMTPMASYPYGYGVYEQWEIAVKVSAEEAKALMSKYRTLCDLNNVVYKVFLEVGKPEHIIKKLLNDEGCSCIVIGSRGLGTIRSTFMGSVSSYVVHHANVPIFVIPPEQVHKTKHFYNV